jgi:radical SAM protein (TIGR01212 family)
MIYRDFSDFLKTVFPFKVQKISVNAGFTCPNRDGNKGIGGCTYCCNQTFSPQYASKSKSVTDQLEEGRHFFSRKYPEMKYLAYFQTYTNTYAPLNILLEKYNEALNFPDVAGLIISTRPDCVPDSLLDELEKISRRSFVLLEYGIESTCNATLDLINRCHRYEDAVDAITRTSRRGICCGAHLILGLPEESDETILSHADKISSLPLTTVKIHQLQIIKGTKMERQYLENPSMFRFFTVDEYMNLCIRFVKRLNNKFYIDRLTSSSPADLLAVPGWGLKNHEFMAKWKAKISAE